MTAPAPAAKPRPTIPDAAGISVNGKSKTSSAVDALLSPTIGTTAQSVVEIPVRYVVPHPRNRKILDDDVADLVASFKAGEPIINPLGVTASADWNAKRPEGLKEIGPAEFIITAGGHRRLRAAELAGLRTVPCIIRPDFAGAAGRKAALLENLHRLDLDAFEEAEAFAELTGEPYKLSQRDLAAVVNVNQSHISKRLKLLKLPSQIREAVRVGKVGARGRVSLGDALELTAVADRPELLDIAWKRVKEGYGAEGAVRQAIADYEREQKLTAAREKLTADGVKILTRSPAYASAREPSRLDGLGITEAKHRKEPCHAGYVDPYSGRITYACSDPKRHKTTSGDSKVKVTNEHAFGQSRDYGAEERAEQNALKKQRAPRAEAIRRLLVKPATIRADERRELLNRGSIGNAFDSNTTGADGARIVLDILGLQPDKGAYLPHVIRQLLADGTVIDPDVLALVCAAVWFEAPLRANHRLWGSTTKWWLELLVAHGYELSEIERHKLDTDLKDGDCDTDDLAGAELATCRVCGCTDAEACEGGCTWIEPDLCSGCRDAAEAGWLDQATTEAVAG